MLTQIEKHLHLFWFVRAPPSSRFTRVFFLVWWKAKLCLQHAFKYRKCCSKPSIANTLNPLKAHGVCSRNPNAYLNETKIRVKCYRKKIGHGADMICTYSFPGVLHSLSSLQHKGLFNSSRMATTKRTNQRTIVKCSTNPVDEDIFGQTRIGILDPAESIHHFSTVQFLNQLLQSSIWNINIVEKSNYCGRLCNGWHFSLYKWWGEKAEARSPFVPMFQCCSCMLLTMKFLHAFDNIVLRS